MSQDPTAAGRIALVGCGNMGEAMLRGWISAAAPAAEQACQRGFCVVIPEPDRAVWLQQTYGVETFESADQLPSDVTVVFLAVKPQVMPDVLPLLAQSAAFAQATLPLVVSIAAGLPTHSYENALPAGTHVVRVMPNMPLQVSAGASVVSAGACATPADTHFVNNLFQALGTSEIVPEQAIDAVCALSGGGPAYFAALAEQLAEGAQQAGLSPQLAEQLARQTLAGTGMCLAQSDTTLAALRQSVCSPGGTTLAALAAMTEAGMEHAAAAGIAAAVNRSKELACS